MKKLIILRTAFIVGSNSGVQQGEDRINQYLHGLNTFFNFIEEEKNVEILLLDNTISQIDNINKKILNCIPSYVNKVFFEKNNFGTLNKGAGLIEAWLEIEDYIKKYDYIIHFEPRLVLENFNFFKYCINFNENVFSVNENNRSHFNTGLFSIKSETLIGFSKSTDLNYMVKNNISIEYLLYDFFKERNIFFKKFDKMNVLWHDSKTNKILKM